MNRVAILVTCFVLTIATGASAQSWEVSALVGLTPSVDLEHQAPEVENVAVGDGVTWTLQLAGYFARHWGAQVQWAQQPTSLDLTASGTTGRLFLMTASQLHGDIVYRFGAPDARTQPFVFGGLGVTIFQAHQLVTETKTSLGLGGGVKVFPWEDAGFIGQLRYKPTFLKDESPGDFCDPFGFCQATLQQFEFSGGVVWRF